MGSRKDQCNKVCRIIDDYLANRPRERDELIIAVRTVFAEADRKTEPQTERYCTNCKHNGVLADYECRECHGMDKHEFIEPQTEKCPFDDSLPCEWVCTEYGKCKYKYKPKTEPQTERAETMSCQECKHYEVGKPCKPFLNECDCHYEPQTDCAWQNDEYIPTDLASNMLKNRFKEQK